MLFYHCVQAVEIEVAVSHDELSQHRPCNGRKVQFRAVNQPQQPPTPGCAIGTSLPTAVGSKASGSKLKDPNMKQLELILDKLNMTLWKSVMQLSGNADVPDPTSCALNLVQDAVRTLKESRTYSQQSCRAPGDTNTTTGTVSQLITQPDIRVGSSWKVVLPGGGERKYSYFWVLYILQDIVVGFWYWSREEIITNKKELIAKNPSNFTGSDEPTKITNAKDNTAQTRTEVLFKRPEGWKGNGCDATPLMLGIFADSLFKGHFVHPVHIVHPCTLEYSADKRCRININSMVPRVHVPCCFNPNT